MYFSSTMAIDPSQLSHTRRKPTKGFRRLAELLTLNLLSQTEEHETFTAMSILQELNVVFRSIGITDVVKITKDGQVLYDDSDGSDDDDFGRALDALRTADQAAPNAVFQTLSLLLEHQLENLSLILEVHIQRVHAAGTCPIQLLINGLDYELQSIASQPDLEERMQEIFATQASYDQYLETRDAEFDIACLKTKFIASYSKRRDQSTNSRRVPKCESLID
jgi:hypothetical protein